MNKKRIFLTFLILIIILMSNNFVIASTNTFEISEKTEEYKKWEQLSEEEKAKTLKPRSMKIDLKEVYEEENEKNTTKFGYSLPSYYNLKDYNAVTEVKNQRNWNLCWAFSGTTVLESFLLNQTRDSYYETCNSLDFSLNPMHVAYGLSYQFSNNIQNIYGNQYLNSYGNNIDTILYWTSGIGPVSTEKFNIFSSEAEILLPKNKVLVETEDVQVENAVLFPQFDPETTSKELMEAYTSLIKASILEYGAVSFGSMGPVEGAEAYNSITNAVYTESAYDVYQAPHMMTIIGWDDTYSRYNFNPGTTSGNYPSRDGAWIVQNSWGTDYIGNGYHYYSYDDYGVNGLDTFAIWEAAEKDYDNIYQYNPTGYINTCTGNYMANIYTRTGTKVETLEEISLFKMYDNTEYEIYINAVDDSLTGENVKYITTYIDEDFFSEYLTIKLEEPIRLTGEKFAIIIKVKNDEYDFNIPIQENSHNILSNEEVGIKPGQSFLSIDGKEWSEITEVLGDFSIMVKGFTKNAELTKISNISLEEEIILSNRDSKQIIPTIYPENADIKKLIWKSSNNSIATVDSNGKVTPKTFGECTITCTTTDGSNISATCNIKIYPFDLEGHWGEFIVRKWMDKGITSGDRSLGVYCPDDFVQKADVLYTINRIIGIKEKQNISSITDVKTSDWYYADVQKAVKDGYIYPIEPTKAYPTAKVNREEFMTMISRALGLPKANVSVLNKYSDRANVSKEIEQDVANYIAAFGFNGNNGRLIPQNPLTRADMIFFIDLAFGDSEIVKIIKEDEPIDTRYHWSKDIIKDMIKWGYTSYHNITHCFYPDDYILKADIIYTLNRTYKVSANANLSKFIDIDSSKWYYNDYVKAVGNGYMNITIDGNKLSPEERVTREEMFYMISKLENLPNADLSVLNKYTDADKVSNNMKQEVANYIAAYGFSGNDGKLIPQNILTKADFMYFLWLIKK